MLDHKQNKSSYIVEAQETLEVYLQRTYGELKNNYRAQDVRFAQSCTAIALDISGMLLQAGDSPTIGVIKGKVVDERGCSQREPLQPRRYDGAVEFGAHVICLSDGLVYDPMVGPSPLPIKEYLMSAFLNKEVELDLSYFSTETIKLPKL
jgi:hypothetical protein